MWVRFLRWEDPLEDGMATHSSILAWRIPWTEEPGRWATVHEVSETQLKRLSTHILLYFFLCLSSHFLSL